MKLIVEGYPYNAQDVEHVLKGIDVPQNKDGLVRVNYVGYFYNKRLNDCVFFLPKVVINEHRLLLNRYSPEELIDVERCKKLRRQDRDFIYGLSVWIYRAVREFQRQNEDNDIVYVNTYSRLDGSSNQVTNTLLDVILSLLRFNNENHDFFMFIMKNIHSGYNKINWTKTIALNQAVMQRGRPVYTELVNKKKKVNFDEELLIIYYSILNYISGHYGFKVKVNANYEIITGSQFTRWLIGYGTLRLRQIKYKYFSDKALALWKHCYAFFELAQIINSSRQQNDYMLVKNFNIVFEAIIDELLSDKDLNDTYLKSQPDGKLVDHIYSYDGLINDNERIYYIGDSKYYKLGSKPDDTSVYKQYTYARNVIQHNLNLFLRDDKDEHGRGKGAGTEYLIYRDPDTEGYNITPNFFISARLNENYDYDDGEMRFMGDEPPLKHFENRLFDRDTLLLQRYDVNFLFVVALYANANEYAKSEFKQYAQRKFRTEIIEYLEKRYQFFSLQRRPDRTEDLHTIINHHFRNIIGRTFRPYSDDEILYLSCESEEKYREENLQLISQLSQDFIIRDYKLGTDPRDSINRFTTVFKAAHQGNIQGSQRMFSLSDFADETILIGGYRSEKNQLEWILSNKKYNVRENAARDGNVGRIRDTAISARLLILYDIAKPKKSTPRTFIISSPKTVKKVTMEKMGYQSPSGQYLLYDLIMEIPFEQIDLNYVIDYARIEEMQHRVASKSIFDGWEQKWRGTPLFFKGSELIRILVGQTVPNLVSEPSLNFNKFPVFNEGKQEAGVETQKVSLEQKHKPLLAAEPQVIQEPQSNAIITHEVDGIWKAFLSVQFRKRYEKRLIDGGEKKAQAKFKMQHFYNKAKDADAGGIFRRRLNDCKTFDDMQSILTDLFDVWKKNLKYPWVRDLFFEYLDFLRELYLAYGNLDDTKESNLTKSSKIQLTYSNGKEEKLMPQEALRKVVIMAGPENVFKMNLKVRNDKMLLRYHIGTGNSYEKIADWCWLSTRGEAKIKYRNIKSILQKYNSLGIKAIFIE